MVKRERQREQRKGDIINQREKQQKQGVEKRRKLDEGKYRISGVIETKKGNKTEDRSKSEEIYREEGLFGIGCKIIMRKAQWGAVSTKSIVYKYKAN